MRLKCIAKNCTTWRADFGIPEIVNHFRTVHRAQPAKMVLGRVVLEVKLFPNIEGAACIKFPNMVEYDGVHFLFTVIRFQNRHYFMFYFIEHELLPEDRQFDAKLCLLPTKSSVPMPRKTSGNQTIIYPLNAAIDNLIAEDSDKLHFVEDEELLENYILHNHYFLEFNLQKLPKNSDSRFIKTVTTSSSVSGTTPFVKKSATGSSDSGIKDNIESREDKNNRIEPINEAGDKFPLDEYVESENQPNSTASNSSFNVFEETQLQKEHEIQPEKLDEYETPLDCMKNFSREFEAVCVSENQSEKVVEHQKDHEKKLLEIDGAINSKGSSSKAVVGKLVSLECPNCHYEICTLTTRAKLTISPLLDREARKSVVFQQKKN